MTLDDLKALEPYVISWSACGSRVTCNPAPSDGDYDYLLLVKPNSENIADVVRRLTSLGYVLEGYGHYQAMAASDFMSWRKGNINLIITASLDFVSKHHVATALCKKLNLLKKEDRIAVFQLILYGVNFLRLSERSEPAQPSL